jgi:8-oxo-dGTP diphosphatase
LSRAVPFQDRGRGTATERRTTTFFHAPATMNSMASASPPPRIQGVVAVITRGDRFLVIERSQFVRAPGMYCFPGGAIEAGESEQGAIRREMQEELALDAHPVRLLWRSVTPWNVALAWWSCEIDPMVQPVPNPLEVANAGWLTSKEMRQLPCLLSSNAEFLDRWESGQFTSRDNAD